MQGFSKLKKFLFSSENDYSSGQSESDNKMIKLSEMTAFERQQHII